MTELERHSFREAINKIKDLSGYVSKSMLPAPGVLDDVNPYDGKTAKELREIASVVWHETHELRKSIEDQVEQLQRVYDSLIKKEGK